MKKFVFQTVEPSINYFEKFKNNIYHDNPSIRIIDHTDTKNSSIGIEVIDKLMYLYSLN